MDVAVPRQPLELFALQTQEHAIILLDTHGIITWCNPATSMIFGYPADELLGKPSSALFTAEDTERGIPEHELETASKNHPAEDDRWLERKDGSRFWAIGALNALRDGEEVVGFAKVLRNRTSQRELVETLRNRIEALEESARRHDTFLSTLSHELANPLGPLVNAVRIIRLAAKPSEEVEYSLRVIERQATLLRTLVSDLLEFSRAGVGKIELAKARCSLHQVLSDAVNDCQSLAEQRRHNMQVFLPKQPIHVVCDRERLHQVFVNLITNAIKYTHPGGMITVKATTEGDEAVARVEDNGVGIASEMLPRIFELFTQVEDTRPMSMGGLGIGLALVKQLVTLHGGTVQVESDGRGKGSEFSVRLPLAPDEPGASVSPPR